MEDFLSKKKETAPILDLSKTVANTKEEFKILLEKIPDFKIKPEKVLIENIKIRDKRFKFKSRSKNDLKVLKEPFTFLDPLPREMKNVKIKDLAAVPIDWKMLTTQRPKSKVEENYFSRLVELKKLENKTRDMEKRQYAMDSQIRKSKNKAGVVEMKAISCSNCGEDFCTGKQCSKLTYDSCARDPEVIPKEIPKTLPKAGGNKGGDKVKKKLKKQRSRSKSKTNKLTTDKRKKSPKSSKRKNVEKVLRK